MRKLRTRLDAMETMQRSEHGVGDIKETKSEEMEVQGSS